MLLTPSLANFQCRVSNTKQGGVDDLDQQFDMGAADQGTSVDDPAHQVTWMFFGDTSCSECPPGPSKPTCFGNAWYGGHGANAIGYLSGASYGEPLALCGSMKLETQPGLVSSYDGGLVFAPDLQVAPTGDAVTNYLFQSPSPPPPPLPNNPQVLPVLPANGAISGTNEGPTGAFEYQGNIYIFYAGGPGLGIGPDCAVGLAKKSVSYLAVWRAPQTPDELGYAAPEYEILSRADYNLQNFTVDSNYAAVQACAAMVCDAGASPLQVYQKTGSGTAVCRCVDDVAGTGKTCASSGSYFVPPTPPGDWRSPEPMGGRFVWITPLVGPDGYLYFFGTGQFRASPISLARVPLSQGGVDFPAFVAPYFADTPGLEYFDANSPTHWNPSVINSTPLSFDDAGVNDSIGEVSVRYFAEMGGYLMAYSQTSAASGGPAGGGSQIFLRWSSAPEGTWQGARALDLGLELNQCLYCQNANTFLDAGACQADLGARYQPSGKAYSADAFADCNPDGVYAPDLLPYLMNVDAGLVNGQPTTRFTVGFMFSSFQPYDSVLFTDDLQATLSP